MNELAQVLANGVIAGSTVAVLAISYTLIYGALKFINFAFGEVLMLGAFAFWLAADTWHLPLPLAALAAVAIVGPVAAVLQILAYRPFYRRSRLACLIAAMGVSIVLQNAAQFLFAGRSLSLDWHGGDPIRAFGVSVTPVQAGVLLIAIVLVFAVDRIIRRTGWGLRLRAVADNMDAAEMVGLDVGRLVAGAFVLGSCMAAASGVLLAFEHVLKPTMGISPGVQAFAACVAGGIGSARGATIAAFAIGILGHYVSFLVPSIAPETSAYAVLLLAIIMFPEGAANRIFRRRRLDQGLQSGLPRGTA